MWLPLSKSLFLCKNRFHIPKWATNNIFSPAGAMTTSPPSSSGISLHKSNALGSKRGSKELHRLEKQATDKSENLSLFISFFPWQNKWKVLRRRELYKSYMKFIFSFSLTFLSSILFLDVPHVLKTCPVWRWGSSERKPNIVCYSLENGWSVSQTEKEGCNRGRLLLTLPGEPICKCKDIHKSGIWKSGTVCNWII